MGNILPSNKNMVDQMVDDSSRDGYPLSTRVEGAFRAVDRAIYYETSGEKVDPYQMSPWREGYLHISAPFIYAKVVEALELKPGMSFLNLGSGTGYLSTVVGLLIAPCGINHGIEVHEQVVRYAERKLEEFLATSSAIDKFEFIKPVFVHGNCVNLNTRRQYDRVYLGAACLPGLEKFMKKLIKPDGGILIMPIRDELVLYKRLGEDQWQKRKLDRAVQFTYMLGRYHADDKKMIEMPPESAASLKKLCRETIRRQLRLKTNLMHPNLLNSDNVDRRRHRRSVAMKRAEERYLKQSRMQSSVVSASRAASSSTVRKGCCNQHCEHDSSRSRMLCRQKNKSRGGVGARMMTRQAARQVQAASRVRELIDGTSSSSYAEGISDLDGNTERNDYDDDDDDDDDEDDDDDSETPFHFDCSPAGRRHLGQPARHSQATSEPSSSQARNGIHVRQESLLTLESLPRPPSLRSHSVTSDRIPRVSLSAPAQHFELNPTLMNPTLRNSIRRSRFYSPTLDGLRAARPRAQNQQDQQVIETALRHLMRRANPLFDSADHNRAVRLHDRDDHFHDINLRSVAGGGGNSGANVSHAVNRVRYRQDDELDRSLLANFWSRLLRLANSGESDTSQDEEADHDFLSPTRGHSSTESLDESSSSSSSASSLHSNCPSNSSSLSSTSTSAASDNDEFDSAVAAHAQRLTDITTTTTTTTTTAQSSSHQAEEPVASRLRSKRLHLNAEQKPIATTSGSGSSSSSYHSAQSGGSNNVCNLPTSAKMSAVSDSRQSRATSRGRFCKRHRCCRHQANSLQRDSQQQQQQQREQQQQQHQEAGSRELEPFAGSRQLSPAFSARGANLSIERRIILASGYNMHRTGTSLSLFSANRRVQQEMRQPILFMNALARSSENWPASSSKSVSLCDCAQSSSAGGRADRDQQRPSASSSQQRVSNSPAAAAAAAANRAPASSSSSMTSSGQRSQLSYLGLTTCKRKRRSSESDSSERDDDFEDDDDDDHNAAYGADKSPSEQSGASCARCRQGGSAPLCPRLSELARSARRRVCGASAAATSAAASSRQGVVVGQSCAALNQPTTRAAAPLDSCDSIKSTDENEPLASTRSASASATSGAPLAANIDDGRRRRRRQRSGGSLERPTCQHHWRGHHHCRHSHKHGHKHRHHHGHSSHCRRERLADATQNSPAHHAQHPATGHHCKRHHQQPQQPQPAQHHHQHHHRRHCCQRHARPPNQQPVGERLADFHVRRRVERGRRAAAAAHSGRSQCRRPARRPGNECEKYRNHISRYIRQLDLPARLLDYLNYGRAFD